MIESLALLQIYIISLVSAYRVGADGTRVIRLIEPIISGLTV